MSRLALLVGVENYSHSPLFGCESDAVAMKDSLERNADGSLNFSCRLLISSETSITRAVLRESIADLFSKNDGSICILYFSGHGATDANGAYLATEDSQPNDLGINMSEIVTAANKCSAKERLIILDCCHAGAINSLFNSKTLHSLSEGVAVLAGCRASEAAVEAGGRGLFTGLVCDALDGGASDVRGNVTMASTYSYVDQTLSAWDQRPLFYANLSRLTSLRRAASAVDDAILRMLPELFPKPTSHYPLDKSYEPMSEPRDFRNESIFAQLQNLRAARLVEPIYEKHMYFAAINEGACRLTPLGQFYWRIAQKGNI